jgi:UDP-glucose 4-epimerase
MRVVVTGGAGFIGSHIVERLVELGYEVIVLDNLSSGRVENLSRVRGRVELVVGDVKDFETCLRVLRGAEVVYHFAANPEVRVSVTDPEVHFRENVVATFNVAEASRRAGSVRTLVFASSSTVYGDAPRLPTPEDCELRPVSVYGASKAAAELILHSYSHLYGIRVVVLRYANVVGPRLRHGVIYDFLMKLSRNPEVLEVLGDGTQRKSYLYVSDAVDATLLAVERASRYFEVFNVGNEDWITVLEIARVVSEVLGLRPRVVLRGGTPDGRGWPGDVKLMLLSIERLKSLGWRPRYSSYEAVRLATTAIAEELNLLKPGTTREPA